MNNYYVYIIRCTDNSLYTGIASDIKRRIEEHKNKDPKCAKYTKSHDYLKLEIYFETKDKSLASKLEYRIKKLKKIEKEDIIKNKSLEVLNDVLDIEEYKLGDVIDI